MEQKLVERVSQLVNELWYIDAAIVQAQRELDFYFSDYIHEAYCRRLVYQHIFG